jgi:hypothetical protein
MSDELTVEEYASEIRSWAIFKPPVDPNVVFDFSRTAAAWERLRWDMRTKGASPGDRNRLDELTAILQPLATKLGLGTVDPDKFLVGDPTRILANQGQLNDWWLYCAYRPREW